MTALAGPPETRFRTKQKYVYKALRDAILACELQPGQRLVIDELARRLEVSAIPIREALQLLQAEGLVVIEPHVGAAVAPIAASEVHEVFAIMEGLETIAAREAALRLGDADAVRLRDLVAEMDAALLAGTPEPWAELNGRLHRTIGEIAAMPMLRDMTDRVLTRWERLRRYFFRDVLVHRAEQAQREHHELVDAILARDAQAVEPVVARHNRNALKAYEDHLRQRDHGQD
jgi:DNA-binding GntR family transcriptional regulator